MHRESLFLKLLGTLLMFALVLPVPFMTQSTYAQEGEGAGTDSDVSETNIETESESNSKEEESTDTSNDSDTDTEDIEESEEESPSEGAEESDATDASSTNAKAEDTVSDTKQDNDTDTDSQSSTTDVEKSTTSSASESSEGDTTTTGTVMGTATTSNVFETASTATQSTEGTSEATTSLYTNTAGTQATGTGETGDADAASVSSTEDETVSITSGKAVALANVLNVINANFVNSEGVVYFSNFMDALYESIDLRSLHTAVDSYCSLQQCTANDLYVNLQNDGTIENTIYITATSGDNAVRNVESGQIVTGDAYAGLNLINVANVNLVDSQYLLVTINAFGDVNGDIVFPSASHFLSTVAYSEDIDMDVQNSAAVANNVSVDADSGNNTLSEVESGQIVTGDSAAQSNVFNQINTSFLGGNSITILFKVHGEWAGEIFGAPDDMAWMTGANGELFIFDTTGTGGGGYTALTATNTAMIQNNVQVAALTGDNHVSGADTALISTGNAYAGANIINIANGTIVGRNWIFAIINIFGDFNGNIAFGRPDLWIGEQIETPQRIGNGDVVTYRYTVINNGDSPATNVQVRDVYAPQVAIEDASMSYDMTENGILVFDIGTLAPGAATEISYQARINGAGYDELVENTVSVYSHETDDNLEDNTDNAGFRTAGRSSRGSSILSRVSPEVLAEVQNPPVEASAQSLQVNRVTQMRAVTNSFSTVRQELVLTNESDETIPGVILRDVLRDPAGAYTQNEVWNLGDVLPREEVKIGYNITFRGDATEGEYTFESVIDTESYGQQVYENGTIWVVYGSQENVTEEMVAGVSTSTVPPLEPAIQRSQPSAGTTTATTTVASGSRVSQSSYHIPIRGALPASTEQARSNMWTNISDSVLGFFSTIVTKLFFALNNALTAL